MNIVLTGKNLDDIRPLLQKRGFVENAAAPELVVAHGGDGTLLQAERDYPGIPKLPIRDQATAPRCPDHSTARLLDIFSSGQGKLSRLPKIFGSCNGKMLKAINDVFIHNSDRVNALRYRVRIDGELYANEIVGDSVGLATVHGSTAYYRSITHSIFRVGLGLAFSNSTEEVSHLVLSAASLVEIEIVRGPGIIVADNSPEKIEVQASDIITLGRLDNEGACVYELNEFMCPKCRALRHPNKLPFKGYF